MYETFKSFTRKTVNGTLEIGEQKILFHSDNAPAFTSDGSLAKVHVLGFKILPQLCPILVIWLPLTSFYFQTSSSGSGERDFRTMRRLSPLWMSVLKALNLSTFPRG